MHLANGPDLSRSNPQKESDAALLDPETEHFKSGSVVVHLDSEIKQITQMCVIHTLKLVLKTMMKYTY